MHPLGDDPEGIMHTPYEQIALRLGVLSDLGLEDAVTAALVDEVNDPTDLDTNCAAAHDNLKGSVRHGHQGVLFSYEDALLARCIAREHAALVVGYKLGKVEADDFDDFEQELATQIITLAIRSGLSIDRIMYVLSRTMSEVVGQ